MRKVIVSLLLIMVLILSSFSTVVYAKQPDKAYTYDGEDAVPSTNAYQVKLIVDETVMGSTQLNKPTDIFVDDSDRTFVLDAGNCRILILDQDYRCIKELKEFTYNGETLTLAEGAQGMFFRESNQCLYIADTENNRILITDLDGNVKRIHEKPVDELLNPDDPYKPEKIIVDNMGIMYVTSGYVNTGALLVDSANNFLGFYGINKIKATSEILMEYLWRSILSDEANKLSGESFQPVEFNNLFWTEDRFVYAVSPLSDTVASAIVKLNALGNDVSPQKIDFSAIAKNSGLKNMMLEDLTVDKEGAITVLEMSTGRIFQFDEGCNLLVIFGGLGYQKGSFTLPVSIESDSKNNLLVLDAEKNTITVMEQTFYGKMIRQANYLYNQGLYEESIEPWTEVLRMNANYTQAYVGMGKAYMSMGEYETAMDYFKLGYDQANYGEAKAALRAERVRENFALIAAVVVLAMVGILCSDQIKSIASWLYWRVKK